MSQVTWPNTKTKPINITSQYIWPNHDNTYNQITKSLYMPYSQNV
ncbi:hypothetical protein F383_29417 [Gossypium arboreum]|uniref:Uncharacterized protein n=1 Tax=Gossypium arboreum TaxID=29729 RepID=A0A0B0PAS1_GOSAR|nr:hypothetical protein F383_29417 [Gossypium arboreum]